ncbi:MAG: EamA family transporter, partial [Flavobacteriaceae bacterium]|nr:EamA family transporter [Flavobacteriaceae bacterium]
AKRLTARFHILTILKWLFLFGFLYLTPFCINDALAFNFTTAGIDVIMPFVYVILFATIGTYLLNMFAISQLKPSVVTVFIYLQPFLASFIAIGMGSDQLDWIKIFSALLILTGVFLTTLKPGAILKWNAARR